jgi:hypothetical protein
MSLLSNSSLTHAGRLVVNYASGGQVHGTELKHGLPDTLVVRFFGHSVDISQHLFPELRLAVQVNATRFVQPH